jgi:hypothetical protein
MEQGSFGLFKFANQIVFANFLFMHMHSNVEHKQDSRFPFSLYLGPGYSEGWMHLENALHMNLGWMDTI